MKYLVIQKMQFNSVSNIKYLLSIQIQLILRFLYWSIFN